MTIDTDITTAPAFADLPARDVLTVDGHGGPDEPAFTAAVQALFGARAALGARENVPLEGTYHSGDDPLRFDIDAPQHWHWRLLVPAPPGATADTVEAMAARFGAPAVLRTTQPTRVARLLHRGPYADEHGSLVALHAFATDAGLLPLGPHTEIYLADPATTAPAELRTILQIPVG